MAFSAIPYIDPSVKYVGASKLRDLNATKLKESEDTLVIQDNDGPLAVILSYEKYLAIQNELLAVVNTMEMLSDKTEIEGVVAGLNDVGAGRTRSFAEIKARLRRKHGQTETQEAKAGD
jgi:PHD/YefM family antitoxin component YafN of YafNO toxin-antitoxin module